MDLWGNEDWWDREAEEKKLPEETDYEDMEREFYHCRACPLRREGGHGPVLSTGPCPAPLMLVGEGPGSVEDEHGLPLIGPSGQLLDRALLSVGITRDHVYVTNIVKCRPRGNRTPTQQEGYFCASRWLIREIGLVKPKVIIALGKPALRFFLGREAGIIRNRGHWIYWHSIPVMPTFHPAYLLRQEGHAQVEAKWAVYYDLKAARDKAAALAPDWVWKSGDMPDLTEMYAQRILMRKELAEPK